MSTEQGVTFTASFSPDSWVDEHADFLYRFACFRLHDPVLAEDLVQETFLSALKNYRHFGQGSTVRTWLVSILKNKIIDHYRLTARRSLAKDDTLPGYRHSGIKKGRWQTEIAPQAWSDDVEKQYDQREFNRFLNRCLEKIPAKFANIFIMHEIDGYSTKEICKELNVSASNVWVMMHRARHFLRDCLQKDGYGAEGA